MTTHAVTRRTRYIQLGVPAAVLGTLSAAIVATPAAAEAVSPPIERLQSTPTRIAPAEAPPASYTVQPGDTISSIASRFGLRTVDVLTWNGLSWRSVIYPGQALALTAGATPVAPAAPTGSAATHTVAGGDTVFSIAQRHGTSVDAVLAANGLTRTSVIYPGQQLALAGSSAPAPAAAVTAAAPAPVAAGGQTHAVAAGDTLFAIAKKHGTTVAQLYALNGMTPGAIIYPGQSLVVAAAPVTAPAPAAVATAPPAQLFANLDAEQAGNASIIIRVGRDLGVPDRAIAIALATAMVESSMRNLSWGDRDSLGLFQQRPSMGWGTPEQAVDPDRSTRVFYGGSADPNGPASRGLLDIPGWESLRFTDAAQAVQISAYPERYGQWENQAFQWLGQHG